LNNITNMATYKNMLNKQEELRKAKDTLKTSTKNKDLAEQLKTIIPILENQVIHYVFKNTFKEYDNTNRKNYFN